MNSNIFAMQCNTADGKYLLWVTQKILHLFKNNQNHVACLPCLKYKLLFKIEINIVNFLLSKIRSSISKCTKNEGILKSRDSCRKTRSVPFHFILTAIILMAAHLKIRHRPLKPLDTADKWHFSKYFTTPFWFVIFREFIYWNMPFALYCLIKY